MLKNILMDGMPDAIVVNGIPFDIYTDFRLWIRVGYMLDEMRTSKEADRIFQELCDLVVKEYPKENILADDFLTALIQFYGGFPKAENDAMKKRRERDKNSQKPQNFDFVFDSGYIYCSFASFYNIRLQDIEYMHWWEFLTLFEGLMMSDQTSVNYVVGSRQAKTTSKMSKDERQRIEKMRKEFALPKSEKEQNIENNLNSALDKLSENSRKKKQGQS